MSTTAHAMPLIDRTSNVPWTRIEEYVVTYPADPCSPSIQLVAGSGEFIAQLVFTPNGTALPGDTQHQVHYRLDDFAHLLDLLRNESPIYYISNGPGHGNGLQTGGTVGAKATVWPADAAE